MTVGNAASIGYQNAHFTRDFHTENHDQGPAQNFGIEHTNGKCMYFLDADGLLLPHALQRMLDSIQKNNADLLVFSHINFDQIIAFIERRHILTLYGALRKSAWVTLTMQT